MRMLTIVRKLRAAESFLTHVSCGSHEPISARYGDAEFCRHCGAVLRPETPGMGNLELALANGEIEWDEYDERRDALLGHP